MSSCRLELALSTLMRMVTGRVAPAYSGMIAGIASSTLQVSTALSVAVIGGIFYEVLGARTDPAAITQAFIVAVLCIAFCLSVGAALSISLVGRVRDGGEDASQRVRPGICRRPCA
ncbi:hypothetical protein [Ancylobacter pratisalsi]|uniref:hypothetical protein n=1 Tax=Ancylobacter pratisalsi TaxID=1745854 RepID=UPI001AED9BE6|nr:hypothetical protein [Ancylobacter pratisalsi]